MKPRIRTIKPELFHDEALWDLGQETGLPVLQGFEGLWCYSDREGRFEWRPRALKAGILPYWDGDFSRVLHALTTRGFIKKYKVEGREFGEVRNLKKHQVFNNREAPSELPPPPENDSGSDTSTREPRVQDASPTREHPALAEGKGREGKGTSQKTPLPPEGAGPKFTSAGGAHYLEVHEAWAEGFRLAGAGTPPKLTGQTFTAAVEFARDVARTHGKSLREAARDIAAAAAVLPSERRKWALSELDPYTAPRAAERRTDRLLAAPATTAADFEHAPPVEDQLDRLFGEDA